MSTIYSVSYTRPDCVIFAEVVRPVPIDVFALQDAITLLDRLALDAYRADQSIAAGILASAKHRLMSQARGYLTGGK